MKRTPSPRKKSPGKKASPKVISVDQRDVGTRFTKREVIHTTIDMTGTPVAEFLKSLRPSTADEQRLSFDRKIADAEKWSKTTLEKAGLPTDLGRFYTIPEGKTPSSPPFKIGEVAGGLMSLLEARGFRERKDPEWYAAQIIRIAADLRKNMEGGHYWMVAFNGVELGELIAEADALEYINEVERKAGGDARGQQVSKAAAPGEAEVLRLNAELVPRHPFQRGRAHIIALKLGRPFDTVLGILKKHSKYPPTP